MSPKIFLVVSCCVAVLADISLVWWAKNDSHPLLALILGMLLLNLSGYMWTFSMKVGNESAIAIIFYALATVMGCSLLGILVFHETISLFKGIGMVLAIISLLMIIL